MKRALILLNLAFLFSFTPLIAVNKTTTLQIASQDAKTSRSFVGSSTSKNLDITEDRIIDLNLLASKFYHEEKYDDAVRIGEECLDMIRAYQGIYNEHYYNQLVNQATYLYALDRYPDCIVYESKALNIAERLKLPTNYDRLQIMSETADEMNARKTPSKWVKNLHIIYDECIIQSHFTPKDIDEYWRDLEKFRVLEENGQEKSDEGVSLINRLVPLALSLGETYTALHCASIAGMRYTEQDKVYTLENAQILLHYAMGLMQGYTKGLDLEDEDIFDAKYRANGVMEVLDSCGIGDHELRVKALIARSFSFSHTTIMGNAQRDAEEAVAMAKRLKGTDSELYDYALYYLTQVSIRSKGLDKQTLDTIREIYQWRTKHYGEEHLMTISALLALAHFSSESGGYEEAENYFNAYFKAQTSFISSCFTKMTPQQQAHFWDFYSYAYHRTIPEMEISRLQNSGANRTKSEIAFDAQLLSKGMKMYVQSRSNAHDLAMSWRDVQHTLKKGDIAVEFVSYHHTDPQNTRFYEDGKVYSIETYAEEADIYSAVVVSPDCNKPLFIRLFDTNEIGYLFFNNELRQQYLSQKLWQPIIEQFPAARRIYFSPDGELYNLPIESLPYFDGEGLMTDRFSIVRLTSSRELAMTHPVSNIASGLLFGGIDYESATTTSEGHRGADMDIPFLPGTESEVKAIYDVLNSVQAPKANSVVYMHKDATEDVLKKNKFVDAHILHIATHGFYFPVQDSVYVGNSLQRSGLLMAGAANTLFLTDELTEENDGILTSEEISHLDLSHINTVVLSACDTARGDLTGDGVEGLQLGFKLAGVNSILMSLWKVDDKATCKLMTEFYSNWIVKKMTKHDALEAAKRTVRETKGWEAPKYWAAFILLDGID